jgi:predicted RNase H-like HicB family nuclease
MKQFTLEYWKDDDCYVGKLKEVPGIFSQGETLEELEENVKDAYRLMMEDDTVILPRMHAPVYQKEIGVDI